MANTDDPDTDPWNFHKCNKCSYKTRFLHCILRHVRLSRTRPEDYRFDCNLDSPEKYQCQKCQFQTDLKILLTEHFNAVHKAEETQHYPRPVLNNCANCDFKTYSSLVLLGHAKCCDRSDIPAKAKNSVESGKRKEHTYRKKYGYYRCGHCSYKSIYTGCLKSHMIWKHTPSDLVEFYQCSHCSYKSKSKGALKAHVLWKHTPSDQVNWFKCKHCSYKSKMKLGLQIHILRKHSHPVELEKLKRFKCDQCPYKTISKSELKLHIFRMHTAPEQIDWFKCEHCTYKGKTKIRLHYHMCHRHLEPAELEQFNRLSQLALKRYAETVEARKRQSLLLT